MIDPGYVGAGRRRDMLASIEMRRASCTAFRRCGKLIDAKFLALALTMLGECSTIISNRTNPLGQAPSQWAEIERLPIELHGNIPRLYWFFRAPPGSTWTRVASAPTGGALK